METIDTPVIALKMPSSRAMDENMLKSYSELLVEDNIPWPKRALMLYTAAEFLDWWRSRGDEAGYRITPAGGAWSRHGKAWSALRETYLHHACPARADMAETRGNLNCFLIYIATFETKAGSS